MTVITSAATHRDSRGIFRTDDIRPVSTGARSHPRYRSGLLDSGYFDARQRPPCRAPWLLGESRSLIEFLGQAEGSRRTQAGGLVLCQKSGSARFLGDLASQLSKQMLLGSLNWYETIRFTCLQRAQNLRRISPSNSVNDRSESGSR